MTPERWRQIEELYQAARERGPEALAKADPELRGEVQRMLGQKSEDDSPLDRPAADLLLDSTEEQLAAGAQLGPYRIETRLGAGGMGEVYRATDVHLGRAVAIKVAQERFSDRFEREARAIAALNHPHICTLHDVGPSYLVMELVEGETLAARLKKGKLSIEQTIQYGAQIADALAAAHSKGIIHRDLKPGNIMLTKSGVKVLDFGLARSQGDETLTASHVVMGTPAYMAPEQKEGRGCDARTDIYALGLVLREMSVKDPQPQFAHVVERCLANDPSDRWQSAGDVKRELEWAGKTQPSAAPVVANKRVWIAWALAGAAIVVALGVFLGTRQNALVRDPVKFIVDAPENTTVARVNTPIPLSPDGRRIAFVAQDGSGIKSIWIRALDSNEPQRLAGSEGATSPFWSPDGQFLGFFAQGKLRKITIAGGPPQNICDTAAGQGASWSPSGEIVFNPTNRAPLMRVSAAGGTPQPLTALETARQENSHRWPSFLPDGRHFLFTARSSLKENTAIYVGSLDTKETKRILTEQSNAIYAPPGYLLFARDGTLMAQRFDLAKLELTGDVFPVAARIDQGTPNAFAFFSVSADGRVIAYCEGNRATQRLAWFDRDGSNLGFSGTEQEGYSPRLSPDGRRLAVVADDPASGNRDVWLIDVGTGSRTRFTTNPANDWQPFWSPDGAYVGFISDRSPLSSIYRKAVDGSGEEELLVKPPPDRGGAFQPEWSPDGRFLAYAVDTRRPKADQDLWIAPLFGDRKPQPWLATEFKEYQPRFSPDGKWVAYTSDESGAPEIYIRGRDKPGKVRVSTRGGSLPIWRRDGGELFYLAPNRTLMAVEAQPENRWACRLQKRCSRHAQFPARILLMMLHRTGSDLFSPVNPIQKSARSRSRFSGSQW